MRLVAAIIPFITGVAWAAPPDFEAAAADARKLLGELVAADTSNPPGNEARAAAIGEAWLRERGISFESHEFAPGRKNLVARLRGDGSARPLLILAHTDVVGAKGQTWATDPHKMTYVDGFLVGRGVSDDLGMAAIALEVIGLLQAGKVPLARDVIVAWTGDEESTGAGTQYALKEHREAIDAAIALNEGGGPILDEHGKVKLITVQVAEKIYQDYVVRATGPTGHSSAPLDENAIYRLSAALERLGKHRFPVRVLEVTRAAFLARASVEQKDNPKLAAALGAIARSKGAVPRAALAVVDKDPSLRAMLRTTCVATQIHGGTRENALPAEAYANVNCRILPDETPSEVTRQLAAAIADAGLELRAVPPFGSASGPSPLEGPVLQAAKKVFGEIYPGVPIVPSMSTGASDSLYLRAAGIAAYGLEPIALTDEDSRRAHGAGERIPEASLRSGVETMYRLVIELAGKR